MPVKAIKKIKEGGYQEHPKIEIQVPEVIVRAFSSVRDYDNFLVCHFINHFDKDKKLIHKLDDIVKINCHWNFGDYTIGLTDKSVTKKYGFQKEEYVELIFQAIERTTYRKRWFKTETTIETIPIFPERIVEDLGDLVQE